MPIKLVVPAADGRMALHNLPCLVSTEPIAQLPTSSPPLVQAPLGVNYRPQRSCERKAIDVTAALLFTSHHEQSHSQGETREGGTRALTGLAQTADFFTSSELRKV